MARDQHRNNTLGNLDGRRAQPSGPLGNPTGTDPNAHASDKIMICVCGLLGGIMMGDSIVNSIYGADASSIENAVKGVKFGNGLAGMFKDIEEIKTTITNIPNDYHKNIINSIRNIEAFMQNSRALNSAAALNLTFTGSREFVDVMQALLAFSRSAADPSLTAPIQPLLQNFIEIANAIRNMSLVLSSNDINQTVVNNNLAFLLSVVNSKNGNIIELIRELNNVAVIADSKGVANSIKVISTLINTIAALGQISLWRQIRAKVNIEFMRVFIVESVVKIANALSEAEGIANSSNVINALKSVRELFNAVLSIGSTKEFNRTRALSNVMFIRYFLVHSINMIYESLERTARNTRNASEKVKAIGNFFNAIIGLMNMDPKKLENAEDNLYYIHDMFMPALTSIVRQLIDVNSTLETRNQLVSIDIFVSALNNIFKHLPSLRTTIGAILKLTFINQKIPTLLKELDQNLVEINNILPQHIEQFDNTIQSINTLFSSSIITNDNIKHLDIIMDAIEKLIKIASLVENKAVQIFVKTGGKALTTYINIVFDVIDELAKRLKQVKINEKKLKLVQNILREFINTLAITGGILLFGALIMTLVNPWDLMLFSATLYLFTKGIISTFIYMSKEMKSSKAFLQAVDSMKRLLAVLGGILIFGSLLFASVDFGAVVGFIIAFDVFVGSLLYVISKAAKELSDKKKYNVNGLINLLLVSAGIVIFASLIMKHISFEDALKFPVAFAVFIGTFILALKQMPKNMGTLAKNMDMLNKLIIISSITIFAIAYLSSIIDFSQIWKFMLSYIGVVSTMIGFLYMLNKLKLGKTVINSALEIAKIVAIIAGTVALVTLTAKTMSIGALFTFLLGYIAFVGLMYGTMYLFSKLKFAEVATKEVLRVAALVAIIALTVGIITAVSALINWQSILAFAVAYTLLVTTTCGALWLIGKIGIVKTSIKTALQFSLLMYTAAATLIFGSMLMRFINPKSLMLFGVTLGAFILGVSLAYRIAAGGKRTLNRAQDFGKLIIISGTFLIFGGLLFQLYPEIIPGVLKFGLVLTAFVIGISFAYKIAASNRRSTALGMLALVVMVGVSAYILLRASRIMDENPKTFMNIMLFELAMFVLVGGMTALAYFVGKHVIDIIIGVLGLTAVGFLIFGCTYVLSYIADITQQIQDLGGQKEIWKTIGTMVGIIALFTTVAAGLGALMLSPAVLVIAAGLGTLAAIGTAITIVAFSLLTISKAMQELDKVKKVDPSKIIGNLLVITKIVDAMMPIVRKAIAIRIAASSIRQISKVISETSKAVEEYATLKIPIYEGTKVVGYRSMNDNDFKSAAKNVKRIITTLGQAIIDTYDANPELFKFKLIGKTKFAIVANALRKLAPLISDIAKSVKDYADMKIGTDYKYINGRVQATKYRNFTDTDFKNAAKNIGHIITVLGKTVIETYEQHPEYFETNFFGNSPFSKVTKSLGKLGPMISNIAKGVKEYADMKIGDNYQMINGHLQPTSYKHLDKKAFDDAADHVKHILDTLGKAVIETYEQHPEYFETNFWGNSPFAKVTKSLGKLGPLISNIASGVIAFADAKIGKDYKPNKAGFLMPTTYENIKPETYTNAAKTIAKVIETMICALYNVSTGEYADFFKDKLFTESPVAKVIRTTSKLGSLISNIASGVKDFADAKIGINYQMNKNGFLMPTDYKHLGPEDYTKAANTISDIVTTIMDALIKIYNDPEHKEMFDDGLLGLKESPIYKVINVTSRISRLISEIAKGVLSMAAGKIETDWDANGKAIKFEHLNGTHFIAAGDNVKKIIENLGSAIIEAYDNDKKGIFKKGKNSKFAQAADAIGAMGQMLGSIAKGIQEYANLKFPIYGPEGKIITYEKLTDPKIAEAKENIATLISTIGSAIIDTVTPHKDWFDDGENSPFAQTMKSISTMGTMLGTVADGIQEYANLKFVSEYDEKGNPKSYKILNKNDFKNAGNNIATVITTVAKTLFNLYDGKDMDGHPIKGFTSKMAQDMFELPNIWKKWVGGQSTNKFVNIVSSCTTMGQMIGTIVEALESYVDMNIPIYTGTTITGYKHFGNEEIAAAGNTICSVISTIGLALLNIYAGKNLSGEQIIPEDIAKNMFTPMNIKVKASGLKGLIGMSQEITGDSPFERVIRSVGMMAGIVAAISSAVQDFALLKIPTGFDSNGVPTGYDVLGKSAKERLFKPAADNIALIITTIGKAIAETPEGAGKNNNPELFKSIYYLSKSLHNIATAVSMYATWTIPVFDKNGNVVRSGRPLTRADLKQAKVNIKKVLRLIVGAIAETGKSTEFSKSSIKSMKRVQEVIGLATNIVNNIASLYKDIKKGGIGELLKSIKELDINTIYTKLLGTEGDNIGGIVGTYKKVIAELSDLAGKNTDTSATAKIGNFISGLLSSNTGDNYTNIIDTFTASLQKIVDLSKIASDAGPEGYETISTGIDRLNTSIDELDNLDTFANYTGILCTYVDAINAIDEKKIDKLNTFTNSLNTLAFKMGNLDSLTKAIAEKLTVALNHLTQKLTEAKQTIKEADKLQRDRHKAIDTSIENITSLMKQELTVKIMQVQDDDEGNHKDKSKERGGAPGASSPSASQVPSVTPIGSDNGAHSSGEATSQTTSTTAAPSTASTSTTAPLRPTGLPQTQQVRGADANLGRIAKKIDEILNWTQRHK